MRTLECSYLPQLSDDANVNRMLAWVRRKTGKAKYQPKKGKAIRALRFRFSGRKPWKR